MAVIYIDLRSLRSGGFCVPFVQRRRRRRRLRWDRLNAKRSPFRSFSPFLSLSLSLSFSAITIKWGETWNLSRWRDEDREFSWFFALATSACCFFWGKKQHRKPFISSAAPAIRLARRQKQRKTEEKGKNYKSSFNFFLNIDFIFHFRIIFSVS